MTFDEEKPMARYWMGGVPKQDDFGAKIHNEFIDGKTKLGPWAIMTPGTWCFEGLAKLGPGLGQRYRKQPDNRWLKVEG